MLFSDWRSVNHASKKRPFDMMWACALLLFSAIWLSLYTQVYAGFEPPSKGVTYYCYTLQCVSDNLLTLKGRDPVVIGVMTYSIADDGYLSIYLGALLELFDMPEYLFVAMVLQTPHELDAAEAAFQFVQYLPLKSIFVSMEHGRSGTGVETLRFMQEHGVAPRVIYHLNHEQPWEVDRKDFLNHIFDSVDRLSEYYRGFDLVLRNYYYSPLQGASYYVPLSPPFEGFVISDASNKVFAEAQTRPASQREQLCHFRGRVNYAKYSQETGDGAVPTLVESDEMYPQAIERREILRLSLKGRLGGCAVSSTDESAATAYASDAAARFLQAYLEHTQTLANTAFALCPAGNNPETFRLIEALELGAIPVMLRPADPEKDFLRDPHWTGYPGPLLGSWAELQGYLAAMTPSKQDALQQEVRSWYAQFKHSKKRALLAKLQQVFARIESGGGPTSTVQVGAGGAAEEVQLLRDLQFRDIPRGPYMSAMQRLLAQVLKLESKVRVLEQALVTALSGEVKE